MEVHRINSYGKDPFTSTGKVSAVYIYQKKTLSEDTGFLKQKIQHSRTNRGKIQILFFVWKIV